ncbi:MAG: glycerate kinase, partial [Bacteroidota bacterium]|nr:glycerate kinase [Bacteroidota bacterium]
KGPYGVAVKAKNASIPVIGIAGKIPAERDAELDGYFDMLFSINNEQADLATALKNTRGNLTLKAREIGELLAIKHELKK